MQARAMAVKQVLVGFYDIPKSVEQPLQLVINPEVPFFPPTCLIASGKLVTVWQVPLKKF